jgi:hypothetical protein
VNYQLRVVGGFGRAVKKINVDKMLQTVCFFLMYAFGE